MPKTKKQVDEHPVIFNGWSVRRMLANEKTQTRRIIKPQPKEVDPPTRQTWTPERKWLRWKELKQTSGALVERCPYGQPGDVLWVREAFRLPKTADDISPSEYLDQLGVTDYNTVADRKPHGNGPYPDFPGWGRKRPSIFMPRELCRLRVRVEDVRVERVQEISNEDAIAEGVRSFWCDKIQGYDIPDVAVVDGPPYRAFANVWEDIHGDGAWDENPWVWVVEFSRTNNDN